MTGQEDEMEPECTRCGNHPAFPVDLGGEDEMFFCAECAAHYASLGEWMLGTAGIKVDEEGNLQLSPPTPIKNVDVLACDRELTEDEFCELYPLLANHLDPNASWDGCLFETFGEELDFVREQNPACVWTLVDDGDGVCLLSGFHFVNRLGYLISAVPVPDGMHVEVRIPEGDHSE